jgi:hypothetical protein
MTEIDHSTEVEQLRARVAALEAELADQAQRSARAIAAAQERAYWLDRWHLDLNALMRRPGADRVRGLLRALRWLVRAPTLLRRRLRG